MKTNISITKEELETLYNKEKLSISQIAEKYNVSAKVINRFFKNYGIEKDPQRQFVGKDGIYKAILKNYSQEAVYDLYIKQNKSNEDLQVLWGCKEGTVSKVLAYYNIHKDKARANEIATAKKIEKWGSLDAYNKYVADKTTETIIQTYGSKLEYNHQKSKKAREVWGKATPEQVEARRVKINNTCKEKYGVEYFCQTKDCRGVSGNDSKPNKLFAKLLTEAGITFEREVSLGTFSYDFKVGNILVEINPTYTHNSSVGIFDRPALDKYYHQQKSEAAKAAGYQCIHVFDWDDQYKVIKLLLARENIYARNCVVKQLTKEETKLFLDTYHLQGYVKANINYGLFYKDELVSLMTFDKPRYNKQADYELIRYCSSKNIIGGAKKLLKHFIDDYRPSLLISYCDNAKFSGKIYESLGFTGTLGKPSKHWYNPKTGQHFTDNLLRKQGFSRLVHKCDASEDNLTTDNNSTLMLDNGFVEIYDAGQYTYFLKF